MSKTNAPISKLAKSLGYNSRATIADLIERGEVDLEVAPSYAEKIAAAWKEVGSRQGTPLDAIKYPKKSIAKRIAGGSDAQKKNLEAYREKCRALGISCTKPRGHKNGYSTIELKRLRKRQKETAKAEAKIIMSELKKKGLLQENLDAKAYESLEFAASIVRDDGHSTADKLKAASLVLTFTMPKPETTTNVKMSGQGFLQGILDDYKREQLADESEDEDDEIITVEAEVIIKDSED